MNKLKWILRTITICCVILPLLFTVLDYRDNLIGLIVPPQIIDAMSGNNQAIQKLVPDISNMRNVEPTFNDDFQFNPEDGTFQFSINVTSPLEIPVTCNSFSLTVTDENGTILGTITLGNPVTLTPGTNSTISIEGTFSQELISLLQNSGIDPADPTFTPEDIGEIGLDLTDIRFTNVDIDIGGIQIHGDNLNPNELFGSLESGSSEEY
ncbi:MAG: hypothetical protein JSV20_09720 [Candidatus Bathyarchaeota archaeon]|nr:MAG: hypothetical protein JSV20_09720 [Candidatus Bathyarchaeota archaeon]